MYFTLLILTIVIYAKWAQLEKRKGKEFIKFFMPIFILLFFTFAFQNGVGTDYESYLASANNDPIGQFKLNQFFIDKEYFFSICVWIAQKTSYPQFLFIIVSLLQNIIFGFSLYELRKNRESIFLFLILYFTLSLCFFNQFNGIRQFISINLVFLAVLKLFNNSKTTSFILVLTAPFFHKSSWLFVVLFIIYIMFEKKMVFRIEKKYIGIISLLCMTIYFIDINGFINFLLTRTGIYTEYIGSNYVQKMSFSEILTKIAKLLVVYYSLYKLDEAFLSKFEKKLLVMSIISIQILILSFSTTLIWRLYLYFDLFLIFPTLFHFKYNATHKEKYLIIFYLVAILLIKILIIPQGEYLYKCII